MYARIVLCAFGMVVMTYGAATAQDMPPMPKPGPEHEVLKMDEGTWDAVLEIFADPAAQPMTSKGVEVNTIGCGGLCLISDFKAEMMPGMTFHGHGTTVWDAAKAMYVGSWTDSMSAGLTMGESTHDAAAKKVEGTMEGRDMTGAVVRSRSVMSYPDADHRVMTMFITPPGGAEVQTMRISYTRRK
jgi:hypothetical protein